MTTTVQSSCAPQLSKLHRFMRKAVFHANEFSKDPSTKVSASFLDPTDFTVLTDGYNGMPRGVDETLPARFERPLKYDYFEHAERNAIYNLARAHLKGSLVLTTKLPTISCARAIASVGAREVYFPLPGDTWEDRAVVMTLLEESGVTVHHVFANSVLGMTGRKARKLAAYLNMVQALPSLLGKDPHGDGTLFLDPEDFTVLTQGYSGMPRGADDSKVERYEGSLRAQWVEGSVRNAIYNLLRPRLKGSLALVTATTCVECARALAGVGVGQVVYQEPSQDFLSRWGASVQTALDMLQEMRIPVTALPPGATP